MHYLLFIFSGKKNGRTKGYGQTVAFIHKDKSYNLSFISRGCLKDNDFVMLLNSGGIDPDEEDDD